MKNDTNKAIVIRFVKAINDHDVDEIINLMSDDHIFIDAIDNKSVGKKGMREEWEKYYELFPDYQIEISDIIENVSTIGLFGYASATYKNLANKTNSNFWRIPASWWKIHSPRAPHSGSTEQTIPEMIEHHKPECKHHNISANLLSNLFIYVRLTLNRNKVLPTTGFSILFQMIFFSEYLQ